MKAKTKKAIVEISSFAIATSTSVMLGWAACGGTTLILNSLFKDGVSRNTAKFLGTVCTLGGIGVAWTTMEPIYNGVRGRMEDVMDVFPTDPEVKEVKDNG